MTFSLSIKQKKNYDVRSFFKTKIITHLLQKQNKPPIKVKKYIDYFLVANNY